MDTVQIWGCKAQSGRVWGLLEAVWVVGIAEMLRSTPMAKKAWKSCQSSQEKSALNQLGEQR